jgi:hypothetical protein
MFSNSTRGANRLLISPMLLILELECLKESRMKMLSMSQSMSVGVKPELKHRAKDLGLIDPREWMLFGLRDHPGTVHVYLHHVLVVFCHS